jgi:hypothetical protein
MLRSKLQGRLHEPRLRSHHLYSFMALKVLLLFRHMHDAV